MMEGSQHRDYELLAEVYRGKNVEGALVDPQIESHHFGVVAVVDEQDRILISRGNIHLKTYIRSAAKPIQNLPLLECGCPEYFHFTDQECAVICSSHNGEPLHVEAVASILKKIGLDESYLQCGAHPPMHAASAEQLLKQGTPFTALHNNCSGKHAGMLACCVKNGYPVENYLDFDHPVQLQILQHIKDFSGASEVSRGTDGCSAPVFYMEILQMARIFAQLAAAKNEFTRRVVDVMGAHPYFVGGEKRFDTDLMLNAAVVAKGGAEGIHCTGVPANGKHPAMGIAVKIADGNFRAVYPVVTAVLHKLGVLNGSQMKALDFYVRTPLKNHAGKEIGFVQAV
jgi:L-asparaginase II